MTTTIFRQAVASAHIKPKGALVSPGLFRELDKEKAISRKLATPWGLPAPSLGIELPYYDEDVYLACDPFLEDFQFKLPPA